MIVEEANTHEILEFLFSRNNPHSNFIDKHATEQLMKQDRERRKRERKGKFGKRRWTRP